MAIRVFLVDDHPIIREGYARLIARDADMEVCGAAGSSEAAFAVVPGLHPDVVLVDLSLPGVSGIELIKRLAAQSGCGAVLVVSAHDEAIYAERALAAGALGYVMKQDPADAILDAIRHVSAGRMYLSEQLHERLFLARIGHPSPKTSAVGDLTDREIEVFEHFGRGRSTGEIADRLCLSPKTVESHRANIKKKLGIVTVPTFLQQAVLWVERSLNSADGASVI